MSKNVTKCVKCKSTELEFGETEYPEPDQILYHYECEDCGTNGAVTYQMTIIKNKLLKT